MMAGDTLPVVTGLGTDGVVMEAKTPTAAGRPVQLDHAVRKLAVAVATIVALASISSRRARRSAATTSISNGDRAPIAM